jgi:hypothetical protein
MRNHLVIKTAGWRLAAVILGCSTMPLGAQPARLSLGPHEHGVGQLNVVLDGAVLSLELLLPAGDVAGFEHLPVTVKERMTVRRVAAELGKAERQFSLPAAAGCVVVTAEVDGEQMEAIGHKHEHDHGHAATAQGVHAHAEYHASYRYTCREPQALHQLEVKVFATYPKLQRLRYQAVLPGGAGAGALTPAATRLTLEP